MTHGRTRIKLYNPISGNIAKDVVSENTFQGSIISEGLRNLGYSKASLYNTPDASNPPFTEIVGGILLLDHELPNGIPNNTQFPPLGVTMTGNGAYGIQNEGEPIELGSFDDNSSPITISDKKIKMTYQYTRSQAVGRIKTVCLTSRTGGYIGIGNKNNKRTSTLWDLHKNAVSVNICPQIPEYSLNGNNVVCNGAIYNFALSGDVLTVKKRRIPLKNASLLDCIEETKTFSVTSLQHSSMGTVLNISASNGKIYIAPTGSFLVGTTYIWCYDTATELAPTEIVITDARNYRATNGAFVCHDKAYIFSETTGAFEIYALDGTFEHTIPSIIGMGGNTDNKAGELGNHVLLQWRNEDWTRKCYIYDSQLQTALEINAKDEISNLQNLGLVEEETSKALCYVTASGANLAFRGAYAFNNPFYLATINNLQTPVTKTTALAMTVEYTLTES